MMKIKKIEEAFENKNYREAIEVLNQCALESPFSVSLYIKRSIALLRIKEYEKSLKDAEIAVCLADKKGKRELIGDAQLRRAIAFFQLKQFGNASRAISLSEEYDVEDNTWTVWKTKINNKISTLSNEENNVTIEDFPIISDEEIINENNLLYNTFLDKKNSLKEQDKGKSIEKNKQEDGFIIPENIKHEWYQNNSSMNVSVFVKNVPKDSTKISILPKSFSIIFNSSPNGVFCINLFDYIIPEKSTSKIYNSKIELKLIKKEQKKWPFLESSPNDAQTKLEKDNSTTQINTLLEDKIPTYPTSSKKGTKNWDSVVSNLKDDEEEVGGDPAAHFFKKLYASSDEDTKKAMMKSYIESNGTSLSTNWEDVKKAKVETHPPEGMVAKKW